MYFNPSVAAPRTDEICPAIRDELNASTGLASVLGGPDRAFTEADDHAVDLGGRDSVWGRCVVLLPKRAWGHTQEAGTRQRLVQVMVRVDVNSPGGGHDPSNEIGRAQGAVFTALEGFRPALPHAGTLLPLYRYCAPTPPAYDPDSGLWFSYALYHLAIGPG